MRRAITWASLILVCILAVVFVPRRKDSNSLRLEAIQISDLIQFSGLDKSVAAQPSQGAANSLAEPQEVRISTADQTRMKLLNDILASKNDNDPRLDTEFKHLGAGAKALLRARYDSFSIERRNERGTIVFLLGRNIRTQADIEFLQKVLSEPACRSLENCQQDTQSPGSRAQLHHETGSEVTLAYPQLVALKALEAYLLRSRGTDPNVTASALRKIEAARQSPITRIAQLAAEIQARYASAQKH